MATYNTVFKKRNDANTDWDSILPVTVAENVMVNETDDVATVLAGKADTGHTHVKANITDFPALATVATSGSYADLSNKPTIPAAQVNSDWNASSGVAQILNKPTIPTVNNTLTSTSTTQALSAAQGKVLKDTLDTYVAVKTATITTTWTGTTAPYTQTINVTGITANDNPIISPVYSTTNATAIAQKTAWNLIGKIVTGAGTITVTCFEEKPVTAIPIQIKGV